MSLNPKRHITEGIEVTAAGHICLDVIPELRKPEFTFVEGRLDEVGPAVISTGGAVSNAGLALHRLGVGTQLMGKVGDDLFGREVRRIVEGHRPELGRGMIVSPGEATSYSLILNPPGRDRMFLHCSGCNDTFSCEDVPYTQLEGTRLFHFGYPPLMRRMIEEEGRELADLLRRVKEAGVTVSLDLSMPDASSYAGRVDWPKILFGALPYVDVFLPSFEETLFTLYREEYLGLVKKGEPPLSAARPERVSRIGKDLLDLGPRVVGLKLGHLGFYLRTAREGDWKSFGPGAPDRLEEWTGRELWSPCFQVEVVGTTGAGDTTIAGFLAALLKGRSPEEALVTACGVGACNAEAADALSGLRGWGETQRRIASGWPRRELPFEMPGWRRSGSEGVWRGPEDSGD